MLQGDSFEEEGEVSLDVLQDDNGNANVNGDVNTLSKSSVSLVITKQANLAPDVPKKPDVSKKPASSSKKSNSVEGKIKNVNPSSSDVPLFTDKGQCIKCKSTNALDECISCNVCEKLFHAVCYHKQGKSKAICSKTFLDSARPIISKYGSHAERWGNFMFICNRCCKLVESIKTSPKKIISTVETINTSVKTINSSAQTVSTELVNTLNKSIQTSLKSDLKNNAAQTNAYDSVAIQNDDYSSFSSIKNDLNAHMKVMCNDMRNSIMFDIDQLLDSKLSSMTLISDFQAASTSGMLEPIPAGLMTSTPDIPNVPDQPPSGFDKLPSSPVNAKLIVDLPDTENSILDAELASLPVNSPTFSSVAAKPSPSLCENITQKKDINSPVHNGNPVNTMSEKNDDYVIVLNFDQQTNTSLNETVKIISNEFMSVPLNFIKSNENKNNIVVSFPSEKHKETGKIILNSSKNIRQKNFTIADGKKMFPKITIPTIPNSLVQHIISQRSSLTVSEYRAKLKECLLIKLLEKNEAVNHYVKNDKKTFDIIYVNVGNDYTSIGVKLSPIIRSYIMMTKYIFIGNTRCKVSDRIDIKQCFKCQRIGHMSAECSEPNVICMYCGASHAAHTCPNKQDKTLHRCTNCSRSSDPATQSLCHTHHSGSDKCPIIIKEKSSLANKTEYSKNI